jgi:MFS family permease
VATPAASKNIGEQRLLARVRVATRALRHRNFQYFIAGQFLSLIGTWVQSFAQSWLVFRLTDSPVMMGLVGFAGQVPYLILSPIGGVIADRVNRHRMVIATQVLSMVQALLLAALTLGGTVGEWHVFWLALALGIIGVFDMTARQSFLVEMVGKEDLGNAIALSSSVYNSGRVLGPAVGGVLVAAVGEGYCFLINAASFVAVIIAFLMMRLPPAARRPQTASPYQYLLEGWRYVRRHAPSRALLIQLGITSVMNYPFLVLMPLFAVRALGGGPKTGGVLMTCVGIGAIGGALYMASRTGLRGLSRTIFGATLAYSVALIGFAFSTNLYVSCALLVVTGFGLVLQMAGTNTSLQSITPDPLRGRIVGFYGMMFLGMAPLGSLMAGWLADWIGIRYTVALGALVCILSALVFNRRRPVIIAALRQIMEQRATLVPVPAPAPGQGDSEVKV